MKHKEISVIQWQGFEIEISFCRKWSDAYIDGRWCNVCHLEVTTLLPERAALPITETGYKSIFIYEPEIKKIGSPIDYIIALLDEAAKRPKWKSTRENARQYSLF